MARTADVKANRGAVRPVRAAAPPRRSPAMVERIVRYFQDVRAEMLKVRWPTQKELVASTTVVLVVLVLSAAYLGSLDAAFTALVKWLLTR